LPCDESYKGCYAYGSDQCINCASELFNHTESNECLSYCVESSKYEVYGTNECVSECPQYSYLNEMTSVCYECSSNCVSCDQTDCLECSDNYILHEG
jgi:hypothetical protein